MVIGRHNGHRPFILLRPGGLFLGFRLGFVFRLLDQGLEFFLQRGIELEGFLEIQICLFFSALINTGDSPIDVNVAVSRLAGKRARGCRELRDLSD